MRTSESASAIPSPSPASTAAYVDDRELARRTGVARQTWQYWRVRREGPPYSKLGARCVYSWAEVEQWIAARRIGGGT